MRQTGASGGGGPAGSPTKKQRGFFSEDLLGGAPAHGSGAAQAHLAPAPTAGAPAARLAGLASPPPFAYTFKAAAGGGLAMSRLMHASPAKQPPAPEAAGGGGASSGGGGGSPRAGFLPGTSLGGTSPRAAAATATAGAASPKVFIQHARASGSPVPPRRVAVERKRREIAAAVSGGGGGSSGGSGSGEEGLSAEGLEAALRAAGIDFAAVPGGVADGSGSGSSSNGGGSGGAADAGAQLLPLQLFYDTELDSRTGEEWLRIGAGALALDFVADGRARWRAARPTAFHAASEAFVLTWAAPRTALEPLEQQQPGSGGSSAAAAALEAKEEAKLEGGEAPGADGGYGAATVHRLFICFASEHPGEVVARLASAAASRRAAAAALRYSLTLDCMPREEGAELPPAQAARLLKSALGARSLARAGALLPALTASGSALLEDVARGWARAQNRVYFDVAVRAANEAGEAGGEGGAGGGGLGAALGLSSGGLPMTAGALGAGAALPPLPPPRAAPRTALVPVAPGYGAREWRAARDAFLFNTFLSLPETVRTLQAAAGAGERVWPGAGAPGASPPLGTGVPLVTASASASVAVELAVLCAPGGGGAGGGLLAAHLGAKSARVEEFEHVNAGRAGEYLVGLREGWAAAVRNAVRENLGKAGKGNMNLKETADVAYGGSKLRRLLRCIGYRMRDELRAAVLAQLHDYVASIEGSCSAAVTLGATPAATASTFPAAPPAAAAAARRPPLFALDVVVTEVREEVAAPPPPPAPKKGDKAAPKADPHAPPPAPVFRTRRTASLSAASAALAAAPVAVFTRALALLSSDKDAVTTVERQVMDRLFWPQDPKIPAPLLAEGVQLGDGSVVYPVAALKERLERALAAATAPLEALRAQLLPLIDSVLALEPEAVAAELSAKFKSGEGGSGEGGGEGGGGGGGGAFNLGECRALIAKHRAAAVSILETLPPSIAVGGLAAVNCADIRTALAKRHADTAEAVVRLVAAAATDASHAVSKEYDHMVKLVNAPPGDIEALTATKDFIASLPDKIKEASARHEANAAMYAALEEACFPLSKDMFDAWMRAGAGAVKVYKAVAEQDKALDLEKARYAEELAAEQAAFEEQLLSVSELVSALNKFDKLDQCAAAARQCLAIKAMLAECDDKARLFNSREALFGKDCTDYEKVGEIKKAFEPFLTLWESAQAWRTQHAAWTSAPFVTLDAEAIDRDAGAVSRAMSKSLKTFERMGLDGAVEVSRTIRDECEAFKPLIPLVTALRNPGMRARHWGELSELIATRVDPEGEGEAFTLPRVIELRLGDYMENIVKVGERAGKEYQIECALDKMAGEWADMYLDLAPYRETGTYVLRGVDDLQTLLDEHTTMTQAISFSAFKKPFAERIDAWAATLMTVSEVLDEWLKVQRSWMYLEPIFSSGDIQKQLPTEYKRFAAVDKNWRATLTAARGGGGAAPTPQKSIQFCNNAKLLERWQEGNRFLELVQKGLSDYLETKRAGFPRFYFLSNDELLEILSQTKDPRAVQPHLKKCFEGIRSVVFESEKVPVIKAMISGEKERVEICCPVDPRGKNVEVWMSEVELAMKRSVRRVMLDAVADYTVIPRKEWVTKWPGMCVLNASQLHWTREMEEGIRERGNDGVAAYAEQQVAQLKDLVVLIRGKLHPLARITLGSLTVVDVHARDVTKKMAASGVAAVNDFDWISQLRYYVYSAAGGGTGNPANPAGGEEDGVSGEMWCHMISSKRPYGYEYLGNSLRLVITPLTDKCYMTLMGALEMNLGGAPAGPAGTGKTETTKDLAKALAKYCVVFNCSDGLDFLAMGKFFKGLASCGAWACFDEFNRIDLEVLSVIAQQVLSLQQAVAQGTKRIVFEGTDIRVDPQFAAFITMNPGYAGRSELPDNLKCLFRPVAMMVPDYALIGEIMLYSFGFEIARPCAEKMVATFKLCSEQLSAQDHYDYGMRAVKTTITAAGNLKSTYPEDDEEELLYRALSDVNLPKFLAPDLPLFKGIMSDLFPRIKKVSVDHGDLNTSLVLVCEKRGLQPIPFFIGKCVQVYEMVVVRHGMMMVGPTGGGKSQMLRVTQDSLTLMTKLGRGGPKIARVEIKYINPKAVTMGQLYGQFDDNTHEWTDGILADVVRECAKSTTPDLKWVNFDGPVDAIWIENMNTVLDDNKKLCLVSGEIVALSNEMTMMFEVEDLAVASPATVSRCGMVYTEPSSMGYDPMVKSWLDALPGAVFPPSAKAGLLLLFDTYMRTTLYTLRRYLDEPVPTSDNALAISVTKLMDTFFEPLLPKDGRDAPSDAALKALLAQLPAIFMFSLIWGAAATSNTLGRARLDAILRSEMESHAFPFPLPAGGLLYDYAWGREAGAWVPWMSTVPPYEPPKNAKFSDLIVATKDTVRYKFLARALLTNKKFFLLAGPTGVGKTVDLTELLSSEMPKEYIPLLLTFSAQTSANQTQDLIDSKLEKRQRGQFGPPAGSQYVLFVDDLNMPQKEKYGAQPPIEILRQWADYTGWYERKERVFRKVIDMVALAAMGPPGGGRNHITMRFVRHFVVVNATPMDDASMATIFTTILQSYTSNPAVGEDVKAASVGIVAASIKVYNTMLTDMLPTPAKPHYTFNLRDLGKVFQGMLQGDVKRLGSAGDFSRLWVHENRRVFEDRLVNAADRAWFNDLLRTHMEGEIKQKWADVIGERATVIYGDYMVPGADPKVYAEVANLGALQPMVEEYLAEYNGESKQPMPLVLFLDALEHVSRIARIIRQPGGNALLLGVGGSGRQSLARLATFMAGFAMYTLEISKGYGKAEWREDLKKLLLKAGVDKKPTVFLFTDTQIVFEGMVEDINNVLNSGDVPNLYAAEDLDAISNACRPDCLTKKIPPTKINVMACYLSRVKENVHVVLAFSPMGDAFRNRLRMFPALVNCTTIDWFSEWPAEALTNVGTRALSEGGKDGSGSGDPLQLEAHLPKVVEFFKYGHMAVATASAQYAAERRRYNYVTPTSYLELLATFKTVLKRKREEVGTLRARLQTGLDKIISTEAVVSKLQAELVAMQPVLVKTQEEVAAMIVQIDKDKAGAAETKAIVEGEKASAAVKEQATNAIAADAQADLDKALPALDAATECLKKLSKDDIQEVKALSNPPAMVRYTLMALCIMFGIKPNVINDPDNPGKKMKDYFVPAKLQLLADAKSLLNSLITFDKDAIPEAIIKEIQPCVDNPDFNFAKVNGASKACGGICLWVLAMHTYHGIAKNVEPKRQALAAANAELAVVKARVAKLQAELDAVEAKIAKLEADFKGANDEKERLAQEVALAAARLQRAHKLLGGLGGEKGRWTDTVAALNVSYTNLVGDALLASAAIAYLGAFTPDFRRALVEGMQEELARLALPHTPGVTLIGVLADPVQVRSWNLAGLPTDNHSVENGIIMSISRRWPLLIDPQGQANRYIKNMGKDKALAVNGLKILRMSDGKFLQGLENAIRFGNWVLIENVLESLEASLEPVLLRQVFKQGGADMIRLGDSTIPYNADFRLFMTSSLPNPHYSPETQVKVSVLNFTLTPKGLEDQMLGVFVVTELPELEERKSGLVLSNARNKSELAGIENKILQLLSASTGNILDDEELINTLSDSKVKSESIQAAVKEAEVTEREIDTTRESFRSVAFRSSLLYFSICSLAGVEPMYQYSLPWFQSLFVSAVRNSPPGKGEDEAAKVADRIRVLNEWFTYSIYKNVCRSLFEAHKPLFSLLMTVNILQGDGAIDAGEWRFLLSGLAPKAHPAPLPNPAPAWLTDASWRMLSDASQMPCLEGLDAAAASDPAVLAGLRAIFDDNLAHRAPAPGKWAGLTGIPRMCLLRCLRLDKVMLAAQDYVIKELGQRFVEPPPFDLASCYEDSSTTSPLIFVLSAGSDPTRAFFVFAESMGMASKVSGISLGQGQGVIAARMIEDAAARGGWVLLQNCHLSLSWMPELERIVEAFEPDKLHRDFRLWLTSMPTPSFPVSLLQNGVKMTNEPPKGLKANIRNSFYQLNDEVMASTKKPEVFRKLLFGLAFFHAVIQERKRFGPLGWNRPYDFNDSDMEISKKQMAQFLDEYEVVPYRVIHFCTNYLHYGGRVTDDKDLRTIDVILRDYYQPAIVDDPAYKFSPSGVYYAPTLSEATCPGGSLLKGCLEFIEGLPLNADPEVFGMHANANITCEVTETELSLEILLALQPKDAGSGGSGGGKGGKGGKAGAPAVKSRDDIIGETAAAVLAKLPPPFDVEAIQMAYPVVYHESMNTVLAQECIRYNKLINVIASTLRDVGKALKGLTVMSKELDEVGTALAANKVPPQWEAKSYPTLKPMASYVADLMDRLAFIGGWVERGTPAVFWVSGFFFPQAFFTGTMQNYARSKALPIDTLQFNFNYMCNAPWEGIAAKPEAGCYIRGLFLEGARFDEDKGMLEESIPKQLFSSMPVIHLEPVQFRKTTPGGIYRCPVYKILSRWGVLATTGHSSNFVMFLEIPTDKGDIKNNDGLSDCGMWVRAGVAAFTQLKT